MTKPTNNAHFGTFGLLRHKLGGYDLNLHVLKNGVGLLKFEYLAFYPRMGGPS